MLCYFPTGEPMFGRVNARSDPIPANFLIFFLIFFFEPYSIRVLRDLGLHRPPIRLISLFLAGINGIPQDRRGQKWQPKK
jgi:hypothetical protein